MQDKFTRMVKSLPSFYKADVNIYVRGLLKAWGVSDDNTTINIQETKNQLYVETASGRFLEALGKNVGVARDPQLSISDEDFRKLIPVMSFYPKQVRNTIVSLLDVFWGPGFTRANVTSANSQTYDLGPVTLLSGTANFKEGMTVVEGFGTSFTTEILPGDYIKPNGADGTTYSKVSYVIDDTHLELTVPWAFPYAVSTSISRGVVRELKYIANKGTERTIRLIPNMFSNIDAATALEVVNGINSLIDHNQYITANVFLDPTTDNRINIRTNVPGLQGSIQITGGDAAAIFGFDSNMHSDVKANVYEINPNEVVIRIPSTIPILRRSLKGAVHTKTNKAVISSAQEPFNFTSLGPTSTLTLDVDGNPYTITFTNSTDFIDASKVSAFELASVLSTKISVLDFSNETVDNRGRVFVNTTAGSGEYQVTGGTANSILLFSTALQQDGDLIEANRPSSYIFDPTGQLFTVTGEKSQLAATVLQGSIQTSLNVTDSSGFPNNPGLILINFGRSGEEGPIRYNGRPNNSSLLIDAAHVFTHEHTSGRYVNLVSNTPTIPRVTGIDYPVFVVGTDGARVGAQALIQQLIAAGVVIRFIIDFPEFLFECVCACPADLNDTNRRGSMTNDLPLVFK